MTLPSFPADLVERYAMGDCIASGGFGAVFHATHRLTGERVAVKLLHAAVEEDPDQVKRFVAEARVVAKLDHPHIVRLREHGMGGDPAQPRPWIVYELATGKSAIEMLEAGTIPLPQAISIAQQTAAALAAAHAAGVVHRDVKPDNIVEIEPGRYALIDFGIALWNDPGRVRTATGQMLATPSYVAPEVVEGEPATPFSDQYSLGVTLYQLLSRRLPFEDESLPALLSAHVGRPVPPLGALVPGLPEWVEAIVLRALAKKASDRFASLTQMEAALAPAGSQAGTRPTAKPSASSRKPARTVASGVAAPQGVAGAPVTRSPSHRLIAIGAVLLTGVAAARALRPPSRPVVAPASPPASVVVRPAPTPGVTGQVTLADAGAALLAAAPRAGEALAFTRRLRQARAAGLPVEAIRASWTHVHDDARWLLEWLDAILRHEQSSHDRELEHYREALRRLEPTLGKPLAHEEAHQRLFVWTQLRYDALGCTHHAKAARDRLIEGMRTSPAEAAHAEQLERTSVDLPAIAPYVDWVASCIDFPEIIDEDFSELVRQMRTVDPGPMLGPDRQLLSREAWLTASIHWAPDTSGPGGKKDQTRRELLALHALRQMDPEAWRAPTTRELDQMIGYALDGLVNQSKVLQDLFKTPLALPVLQRTAAPGLMTLSLLISHTQSLLLNVLDEKRLPIVRIKLIRGASALDRLVRKQAPRRRARFHATVQACAQRPDQRWVTDLFEARKRHEENDHAGELALYAQSFRAFEKRYFQDKSPAMLPPDIIKAWVELRSGILKACSRRKEDAALHAIVREAQAGSRFDTEHIDELAKVSTQHADDLRKLRDDERAANTGK